MSGGMRMGPLADTNGSRGKRVECGPARSASTADRMVSNRSSGAAGQGQSRAQHGARQRRLEAWLRMNYQKANWRISPGALPNVARGPFHEVA